MGIRYLKKHAALEGVVGPEDAETLSAWLQEQPVRGVHLGRCEHVHAAVLQVLMALRPRCVAAPSDAHLAGLVAGPR